MRQHLLKPCLRLSNSVTHVFKISRLTSSREYYRVLKSFTDYYRALQSIIEYYRVLQSVTEYYRVLQSVIECYSVRTTFALRFWPKCDSGFWGALFFILGYQLATFGDQSAMLGQQLSQKLPLAPPYNPIIWPKTCPELKEVEVRICVWPNFPIINLILLLDFHKFARSRGPNTCAREIVIFDGTFVKSNLPGFC